jgi:hypothetical protein
MISVAALNLGGLMRATMKRILAISLFTVSLFVRAQTTKDSVNRTSKQRAQEMKDAESWKKLKCTPRSHFRCEGSSCTYEPPVVHLILNRDRNIVSRCDAKGCDDFEGTFVSGGMYTNIQGIEPRGLLVKVLGNSEYVEVATSGLVTHVSTGACSEIP